MHSQTVHLAAYERPKPPYPEQKNPESWLASGSVEEGEGNLMAEAGAPGLPGGGFGVAWPTLRLPADTSSPMRSQTVHHAASENPNPPETEQTLNFRTPRLKGQSCERDRSPGLDSWQVPHPLPHPRLCVLYVLFTPTGRV